MSDEEKPNGCLKFVWNSDENKFFGRTGMSWLLIAVFYICLYVFLALFFVACLVLFYETLRNDEPKWKGEQSLTLGNPGIGMRPMPEFDSTLIAFQQGKPSSYKPYTDHLEAFLLAYEDSIQSGRNLIECQVAKGASKTDESACRVDLDKVIGKSECNKEQDFGYETGEPCVLLKINRVFGFTPIPYETVEELLADNGNMAKPRFLAFTPNVTVGVSCEGESAADRENILDNGIEFYPNPEDTVNSYSGIPVINFPYLNQEGYRSPFIMVKFRKFNKRVVIQVECKVYAKNIDNSGSKKKHGTFNFEILKD